MRRAGGRASADPRAAHRPRGAIERLPAGQRVVALSRMASMGQ